MTTNGRAATDDAAIRAAHAAADKPPIETIELANGIVLRIRPVATYLLGEAARSLPAPQPPRFWVESRGVDRDDPADPGWEENPDSPSYKRLMEEHNVDTTYASLKVALLMGTSVESIPEGMYPPESPDWINEIHEMAEAAGLHLPDIRETPEKARYLDWLRLYAIPSEDDIFRLAALTLSGTLVTEEALADRLDTFRRGKAWAADLAASIVAGDSFRDRLQADVSGDSE